MKTLNWLLGSLILLGTLTGEILMQSENNTYAEENAPKEESEFIGDVIPGGWTVHKKMDAEGQKVLKEAIGKRIGVRYEPVAYATQVVAGLNYCYLCIALPVTGKTQMPYFCSVTFYKSLDGKYNNFKIQKIAFRPEDEQK